MSGTLFPEHEHSPTTQSAISSEFVALRGYRTVTKKVNLRSLGFSQA